MTRFFAVMVFTLSLLFASQVAMAQPEEGQYYRIKCVNSKKVLAIDDAKKGVDARVIQAISGPKEVQQWKFVKAGDYYKIVNRKTGMALNVINASKEEGAAIIQWEASDEGENQQWKIEKKGGNYVFKARHSGMVLDVAEESKKRKAPVIQYSFHEGLNQIFELEPVKK